MKRTLIAPCQHVLLQAEHKVHQLGIEHHSHDNFLSLDYGFTLPSAPLLALPASHLEWDEYAKALPEWMAKGNVRSMLASLSLLSASHDLLPDNYLLRASTILTILAHAFYAGDYLGGNSVNLALPNSIKMPWKTISQRLNRPHLAYTVYEGVLYNWRFKSEISSIRITENTDLLIPLIGNREESITHMMLADTETQAIPLIGAIINAQNAVLNHDNNALENELCIIFYTLDAILSVFMKINLMPQAATYFHPIIWSKTATVISARYSKFELGMSGASLPCINLIDAFLGRTQYETEMGKQEITRRSLLPKAYQQFIAAVEQISVRAYIEASGNQNLISLWQQIYEKFAGKQGFLGIHQRKIFSFIQMGMKAGRVTTNAGYPAPGTSSLNQNAWDIIDEELHLGRIERYLLNPEFIHTARVTAIRTLNNKTTHLELQANSRVIYQEGYRCKLYVENSASLIEKTLCALHAKHDSLIELSQSWQLYLTSRLQKSCPKMIKLSEFLKYAKIRPLTREIAQSFYKITGLNSIGYLLNNHLTDQFELWDFFQFLERYSFDVTQLWKFSPWQQENLTKLLPPEMPRIYSISSAYNPNNPCFFSLTVGYFYYTTVYENSVIEREGTGSLFINDLKTAGQKTITISIEKPFFFSLENAQHHPAFFFAGGLGIAPFRGALQSKAQLKHSTQTLLFLSIRTAQDLLYFDELRDFVDKGLLTLYLIFTQDNPSNLSRSQQEALIHPAIHVYYEKKIDDVISALSSFIAPYLHEAQEGGKAGYFYICGGTGFCKSTEVALAKVLKKSASNIIYSTLERLIANKRLSSDVFTHYSKSSNSQSTIHLLRISEIAQYNNATNGYWIIINDSVYDVTDYALKHPGGNQILYSCSGIDATEHFKKVDHFNSVEIMSVLGTLKIGQVNKPHFCDFKRFICLGEEGLTTISLNELYDGWIEFLFDIVDIENRLNLAFSCYKSPPSSLITKMILDGHELLVSQLIVKLYDLKLATLWKKSIAIFAPSAPLFDFEKTRSVTDNNALFQSLVHRINSSDDAKNDLLAKYIINYDLNWVKQVKESVIIIHRKFESPREIKGALVITTLKQLKTEINKFALNFSSSIRKQFKLS